MFFVLFISSPIRDAWPLIFFIWLYLDLAQVNPASPPQSNHAISPADGYPSSPELKPFPFLSTSCREK
jgi:hypothetical protein